MTSKRSIWQLIILLLLGAAHVAHSQLPASVRADMLAKEIVAAAKAGDDRLVLDRINQYRALEQEGHQTPPAILFLEAKAASKIGNPSRGLGAIQQYLTIVDRNDSRYAEALELYSTLERQRWRGDMDLLAIYAKDRLNKGHYRDALYAMRLHSAFADATGNVPSPQEVLLAERVELEYAAFERQFVTQLHEETRWVTVAGGDAISIGAVGKCIGDCPRISVDSFTFAAGAYGWSAGLKWKLVEACRSHIDVDYAYTEPEAFTSSRDENLDHRNFWPQGILSDIQFVELRNDGWYVLGAPWKIELLREMPWKQGPYQQSYEERFAVRCWLTGTLPDTLSQWYEQRTGISLRHATRTELYYLYFGMDVEPAHACRKFRRHIDRNKQNPASAIKKHIVNRAQRLGIEPNDLPWRAFPCWEGRDEFHYDSRLAIHVRSS